VMITVTGPMSLQSLEVAVASQTEATLG
jgi:hypothetical protein